MQLALADLRGDLGDDVVLIADLCVDEYTDHGHCGVLDEHGDVDNDTTLEIYAEAALAQARAGAHVVAPSGMMDGQVGRIRAALDGDGLRRTCRSSPTRRSTRPGSTARSATPSTCTIVGGGDRKGYQQDWRNAREALREIDADIAQGADMVMVKPALAYLDVIAAARAARRRARRGVPRQRRVRHDQGRRGQRLDRRRRRRPRAPHGDQAGRRRRHPHVPRPVVRRGSRARRDGDDRSRPVLRRRPCAGAGCDPVVCTGAGVPSNDELFAPLEAGDPRRRQLVDPGLQGRSAAARTSSPAPRARTCGTSRARRYIDLVQSYGAVILGHAHPAITRGAARRGARRHVVRRADAARDEARRGDRGAGAELRAGAADELRHRGDEHRRAPGPRRTPGATGSSRSTATSTAPPTPCSPPAAAASPRSGCPARPACPPARSPRRWSCRTTWCPSSTTTWPR